MAVSEMYEYGGFWSPYESRLGLGIFVYPLAEARGSRARTHAQTAIPAGPTHVAPPRRLLSQQPHCIQPALAAPPLRRTRPLDTPEGRHWLEAWPSTSTQICLVNSERTINLSPLRKWILAGRFKGIRFNLNICASHK